MPSVALSSQTGLAFSLGRTDQARAHTYSHTASHSPRLLLLKVSTSVIHVNTWINTHLG